MINEAKPSKTGIIVDLHPNRPAYRGFQGPAGPVSLERDPTFEEIEAAGAIVVKNDQPHTLLEDMFLVSGEIPRVTSYEVGVMRGLRFNSETAAWESDELILDERFLMCNVKGILRTLAGAAIPQLTFTRQGHRCLYRMQSCRSCQRRQKRFATGRQQHAAVCRDRRLSLGGTERGCHQANRCRPERSKPADTDAWALFRLACEE